MKTDTFDFYELTNSIRKQKGEQVLVVETVDEEEEEEEIIPVPMEDDTDLFSIEGESQSRTVIQHIPFEEDVSFSDSESSSERGLPVLVECEGTDITQLELSVKEREDELVSELNEVTPGIHQTKLQMELASLYQESGFFEKAVQVYQNVVEKLEKSIQHEDHYHHALRCLSVCLREIDRSEEAVNLLNKDIDILVFRKTRFAGGGEYRQYYDCELQRSYEELGNSYMKST